MKNELFHAGSHWLNLFSMFILVVPLVIMLFKKSSWNIYFLPLTLCFLLLLGTGLINNEFISPDKKTSNFFISSSIVFQAPLILIFLNYFSLTPDLKKALHVSLLSYLIGGGALLAIKGLNGETIALTLGVGLSLVLIYGLIIFFRQIKESIHKRRETGKAFMISAIVFAYSCYLFIYLMNFVLHSNEKNEVVLLFQLATIISTLLMSIGLLININTPIETKEVKKSSKLPMLTEWEEYTTGRN